ncbi:MAG: DUF86 domain-containing protein [Candidatus Methylomirabilis sp.]|nr:DUF86 domain-containing protein [Deltaproteobacteria bacterium]
MLRYARLVSGLAQGKTFEDYLREDALRLAVERGARIVGEASRRDSDGFKRAHPEIPWRAILGQRNVLVHEYGDLQDDLMWEAATVDIPALIETLAPLVPPPDPEG